MVDGVIKQQFPNHELDVFDVSRMVKNRPDIVLVNSFVTLLLYGVDIARRRKKFRLSFWRTPYIFRKIRELVQRELTKEDYCFSFQMQSLFDASVRGLPHFVYTDHTHLENRHYSAGSRNNLYSPSWIELEKSTYHNATLNFVRSSNVQRSMIEDYDCASEHVRLVYAGSNAPVSSEKMVNIHYTVPHILFVGFDWLRKGGPDLVEAFKIVQQKIPDARLTVVGANPQLNIPNCEVIGPGRPEELDQYYQRASVFCLPTYREPFGIVFLEAMKARLPIVATRVGAIPDFVEEGGNGWLVEPGDITGLANALIRLLQNPHTARKLGERSHQIIEERYTWEAVGNRLRQEISEVLAREEEVMVR